MSIESFEDVISWQKSLVLYILLSGLLKNSKDYSFKDQLLRASLSISNNIAEGFDRGSNKELKQFLVIARGSAAEVRSMLIIAGDLELFPAPRTKELTLLVKEISKLLTGFIKSIQ